MPAWELKIVVSETGQVTIHGPIDQLLQCYGLLELGKDILRQRAQEMNSKKVQPPGPADVANFGGRQQ